MNKLQLQIELSYLQDMLNFYGEPGELLDRCETAVRRLQFHLIGLKGVYEEVTPEEEG